MFSKSALQILREDALIFYHESEVLVKGVYFCFASETELGTDFRGVRRGHDSVNLAVHKLNLTNVAEQF